MATRYSLDHVPESVKVKYVKFKKMPGEVIVVDPKDVDLDEVEVIGRVDMRQGKFKGGEEYGYIQFDHEDEDTAYDLYKKSKGKVVGYLLVRDGGVIAVEKESSFILLILFLLLLTILGIVFGSKWLTHSSSDSDVMPVPVEIKVADGTPFDGTIDNGKDSIENEIRFIEFPAFTTIYVQQGTTIDLVNPETNHVYFKYTIFENDTVLYESDYVAPGQKYAWDATKYITGAGEHSVVFSVSTIGVDDRQPRNGAEFAVTAIVS